MADEVMYVLDEEVDTDDENRLGRHRNLNNVLNKDQIGEGFVKTADKGDGDDLFGKEEAEDGAQFMAIKPWKGAIVAPSKPPKINSSAPEEKLDLEWVYGYRGFDSRSNVGVNNDGHIVYPMAGTTIVYDPVKHTQRHFLGNNDDIVCLAQNPSNKNIFATGQVATIVDRHGVQPHICVWDSTNFDKCWVLPLAHQRSVRCLSFSADGKYLASVGDDDQFTVKVWDWANRRMLASQKGDSGNQIIGIKWNHVKTQEFVTVGKNHIFFWTFENNKLSKTKAQLGSYPWQTFYAAAFSEKGFCCVGARDGSMYILVEGSAKKAVKSMHKADLNTIERWAGGIISGGGGGNDGGNKVLVLDSKLSVQKEFQFSFPVKSVLVQGNDLLVGTQGGQLYYIQKWLNADSNLSGIEPIVKGHFDGEAWALCAHPTEPHLWITAGEDNRIFLFDGSEHKIVREGIISDKPGKALAVRKACSSTKYPPNQCVRGICFSPRGDHFIVGNNKGEVIVYRTDDFRQIAIHDLNSFGKRNVVGQTENWIQTIKYSPSGKTVAVGTHGIIIVLLDVKDGYKPKGKLDKHSAAPTQMDWSLDGFHLQSTCMGYELLFWDINEDDLAKGCKQNTSATALRDVKWASQNCCFGWTVQGIFDPTQDGSDINGTDTSHNKTLIATGDDYGNVNIFRWPCAEEGAQFKAYEAHSSHVVNARFSADDKYLYSSGGADKSIIQWAISKEQKK